LTRATDFCGEYSQKQKPLIKFRLDEQIPSFANGLAVAAAVEFGKNWIGLEIDDQPMGIWLGPETILTSDAADQTPIVRTKLGVDYRVVASSTGVKFVPKKP
jgi:hypothetical protein